MKKNLIIFFTLWIYQYSSSQHLIILDNTSTEDITVRLTFMEDDPSCPGVFTTTTVFVPQTGAPSVTPAGAPTGPIFLFTLSLSSIFDNILYSIEVLSASGIPISFSSARAKITPNTIWPSAGCIPTPPLYTYTSAFTGITWTPTWTSIPTPGTSTVPGGNLFHTEHIVF